MNVFLRLIGLQQKLFNFSVLFTEEKNLSTFLQNSILTQSNHTQPISNRSFSSLKGVRPIWTRTAINWKARHTEAVAPPKKDFPTKFYHRRLLIDTEVTPGGKRTTGPWEPRTSTRRCMIETMTLSLIKKSSILERPMMEKEYQVL